MGGGEALRVVVVDDWTKVQWAKAESNAKGGGMNKQQTRRSAILVAAVFSLAKGLLWAQGQISMLSGVITDATGSVVPGALVRVTNVETGENYQALSNEGGNYTLPLVKPGRYDLAAEAPGFKRHTQSGIVLETGIPARLDVQLEVGVVSESVSVEASVALLQTATSSVGAVVENRTIVNMPLINRRAAQLARLNGFMTQVGTGSNFTIAGGRGDNSMWYIDGGNVQNVTLGVSTLNFDPPIESLQEFNVSISNYAAELGRTGGGVIQMTTKSGTNQLHGSAYGSLRNNKLDARSFFAASKPKLRDSLFGASIGGPVLKDKTHYFFNYEGRRAVRETTQIVNVPTRPETRGDFSASTLAIRDPEAAGRPRFANNIIPVSRLDPVGAKLAAFYPEPNVSGRPSGSSNFLQNQSVDNPANAYVARLDHIFADNDRIYGRFLASSGHTNTNPIFPTPGTDQFHEIRLSSYFNASGTWFHNFTPTVINELRHTWGRRRFINLAGGTDRGLAEQIGIKGTNPRFFPQVTLSGLTGLGRGGHERLQVPILTHHIADFVTLIRGNHALKFGGEWRFSLNDDVFRGTAGGRLDFNDVATGSSLASLLLGWTRLGSRQETLPLRSRANATGGFVQDDWKVTPKLTLNLGLRWDLDQPRWEQFDNRQSSFDRFVLNPVSGTPGTVVFSGRNGLTKFAHNHDWNNFGPRFGFAWQPSKGWSIRGGAAVVYVGQYDTGTPTVANLGFSIQGQRVSPDNGLTPALLLRNGLPPIPPPTEADLNPGFGAVRVGQATTTAVEFFERDRRQGYLETFNINVQRQLPLDLLFEVGYLGTLGHKLPAPDSQGINQVRPELLGPGNAQVRRPFPQFSNVQVLVPAIGNSNYHGLNFKVQKRYSAGLHFQANYTWSRLLDDVESRNELGGNPGSAYADFYNRRGDRGLSGNNVSHRFIWSSVYELPVGRGRPLNLDHPVWRQLFAGWTTGLIAELRTGPPWGVAEDVNRTNSFSQAQRPNVVGEAQLSGDRPKADRLERWFNTAAFAQPPEYTFGNAGRTSGYGPGAVIMDLSILKDFSISEAHRLQFRCEMLNFINRANFGLPVLQRGNRAFGRITSLIDGNQARIVQMGLHYKF